MEQDTELDINVREGHRMLAVISRHTQLSINVRVNCCYQDKELDINVRVGYRMLAAIIKTECWLLLQRQNAGCYYKTECWKVL